MRPEAPIDPIAPADAARGLPLAFAAVVALFVGGTALSYEQSAGIDAEVEALESRELPSVAHLLTARAELRDVATETDAYRVSLSEGWPLASYHRERARTARARLEEALRSYEALGAYPGERVIHEKVVGALPQLDELVDRVVSQADAPDAASARATYHQQLAPLVSATLSRLAELATLHATRARDHGAEIRELRARFRLATVLLDVLAVLAAAAIAWRTRAALRRAASEAAERSGAAARAVAERDALAAQVVRELGRPLANVREALIAEAFPGPTFDATRARAVATLARVARTLDTLAAVTSGAHASGPRSCELVAAVDGAVAAVRADAAGASAELRVERLPDVSVAMAAATLSGAIAQILRRALATMGDAPLRRVFVRADDRGDHVRLEIHDTGIGADEAALATSDDGGTSRDSLGRMGVELAFALRALETAGAKVGGDGGTGAVRRTWIDLPRADDAH